MISPEAFNLQALGHDWNLGDIPQAWPGYAILNAADADRNRSIEGDERFAVDWRAFSGAVWDFQAVSGLGADGKLGRMTLPALREAYRLGPPDDVLLKVGDLVFRRPEQPTARPRNMIEGVTPAEMQAAACWNNYGAEIARQARLYDMPVESALIFFLVEAGGQAYGPHGLVKTRVEWPGRYRGPGDHTGEIKFVNDFGTGQAGEYRALQTWAAANQRQALEKTSVGLGQVMGFNHLNAGFETPEALFLASQCSCAAQVEIFFRIIKAFDLIQAVRDRAWRQAAGRYNGNIPVYSELLTNAAAAVDALTACGAVFKD